MHYTALNYDVLYYTALDISTIMYCMGSPRPTTGIIIIIIIIIIYPDFLPTPRRGSHVKSDNTHTKSSRYTP